MVYRYLFWQESAGFLRRVSLATHKMLTLQAMDYDYLAIKLDCINKQVYSIENEFLDARDYDGWNYRMITIGQFSLLVGIFGVFNGSLYFMNNDRSYIKEMNLSNRNYVRSIAVDRNDYRDLVVVHKFLQPLGKL